MATNKFTHSDAQKPSSNSKNLIESLLQYFTESEKDTINVHVKPDIYILTEPVTSGFIKYISDNGSGKPELTMTFPPENNVIFQTFSQTDKKTEFVAIVERPKSKCKTEGMYYSYTINPSLQENKVDRSTQTITGRDETQQHQGKSTPELESICAERVNSNGESTLLLSLTYQDNNKNYDSTPCLLFHYNGAFYTPEAFRFLLALHKIDKSKGLNIVFMSRNGKHVHIEKMEGVSSETAKKITNEFQNLEAKLVKQACNLKDIIKITNDTIDKSTPSEQLKSPVVYRKLVETEQKTSNDKSTINREENVSIWRTRVATKCVKRKHSKQSMWKIYLQSHDDNVRDSVHEYFSDDLVCKSLYEFYGRDIHPWTKFPFERPHVTWPSMHPLLPYKLRYLDDDETDDEGL